MNTGAFTAIEKLRREGPLTIVHYGSSVASRQLAYYFPDAYVVVLPATTSERPQVWFHHQPVAGEATLRPGSKTVVCLLPWNSKGAELPGWSKNGPVYYRTAGSADAINVGPFLLIRPES
jgi:hypothetical protein